MINIIDYGVGNLKSVLKLFEFLNLPCQISSEIKEIEKAKLLVLPGVGAFQEGIKNLRSADLVEPIKNHIGQERPFLGICLGFQLLFESSTENGFNQGLGIFKGQIKGFSDPSLKVPHMGWNTLDLVNDPNQVYANLSKPYVYFVHSYYLADPDLDLVSTKTTYGIDFVSSIQRKNLLLTQFHPEKSGQVGITILKNFLNKVL